MIQSILIPIALRAGANILAGALRGKGGAVGNVAADAVKQIGNALGVPATPDAIQQKFDVDPDAVMAATKQFEADNMRALAEVIEAERGIMQIQSDMQERDIKKGGLNALWRPLNGVAFMVECLAIVLTFCVMALRGDFSSADAAMSSAWAPILALLGTVLGTHASVVGTYVFARRDEKKAGVA